MSMQRMQNMHMLTPCALCDDRMAVPGTGLCTMCDVTLYSMVPEAPPEGLENE